MSHAVVYARTHTRRVSLASTMRACYPVLDVAFCVACGLLYAEGVDCKTHNLCMCVCVCVSVYRWCGSSVSRGSVQCNRVRGSRGTLSAQLAHVCARRA